MGFIHPKYGFFMPGWRDVKGYEGLYKVNETSDVFSMRQNKILKYTLSNQVSVVKDGIEKKARRHRLSLEAFFPEADFFVREEGDSTIHTVDHIDEDHTNNHVCNLQHLSIADNSRKNAKEGTRTSASKGLSKPLVASQHGKVIREFSSASKCCEEMGWHSKSLREAMRAGRPFKGFMVSYKEFEDEPGEIWKTSDALQHMFGTNDVYCSNKGRIKTANRPPTRGVVSRDDKYGTIRSNHERFQVHHLVFAAWYNVVPPEHGEKNAKGEYLVMRHDDNAPLTATGTYRNFPEDLSVGTQSENIKEYHAAKKKRMADATCDAK